MNPPTEAIAGSTTTIVSCAPDSVTHSYISTEFIIKKKIISPEPLHYFIPLCCCLTVGLLGDVDDEEELDLDRLGGPRYS